MDTADESERLSCMNSRRCEKRGASGGRMTRPWTAERYVSKYLDERNFYHIQTGSVIDNPDQRIVDDIAAFTSTSTGLFFTLLNAGIDLVSFSGILLGIYKPLVAVLFVYATVRYTERLRRGLSGGLPVA